MGEVSKTNLDYNRTMSPKSQHPYLNEVGAMAWECLESAPDKDIIPSHKRFLLTYSIFSSRLARRNEGSGTRSDPQKPSDFYALLF